MDYEKKVFFSDITRVDFEQKNNLYELINITPAKPIPVQITENKTCIFEPKCDKYYVPKKKSKMKVRTVKEIRNLFEQDNYQFIIEDMEKQQSALLTKIRTGSATDESTKTMAKKLLIADHPISRTAWQMLNNINPDKNANPTQFVLWNGRRIRVVGSRGGKQKFVCNHELGKNNIEEIKKKCLLRKYTKKKNGLLRNSLNVKFKPGPLRRKKNLDDSHQKYHMGPVELVKLPKPALEIQPMYGIVVEPLMSSFLNNLRAEDGTITEKWAKFAVSVLGTVKDNDITQVDKECCVTFDLSYKCGQDRILMRRDISKVTDNSEDIISANHSLQNDPDNLIVIQETLNKMLDSVEISLKQDCLYSVENESPQALPAPFDHVQIDVNNVKERNKKKYGELDRLAVTVIQLPGTPNQNSPKICGKPYCNLGCLCDSLSCTYKFKQHCGFLDCMFGCKCELSKYKDIELLDNDCADLIPGLMKLDNEINASLAKEEQKFHQTVVVSGEKSIVLKSRKRTSKSTMKYAEFFSSLRLKNGGGPKKILTIVSDKLNCTGIEPWCMVHNLYKCFCKGRFVETSTSNKPIMTPTANTIAEQEMTIELSDSENDITNHDIKDVRPRTRRMRESTEKMKNFCLIKNNFRRDLYEGNDPSEICARTNGYLGRKYDESYYKITNQKILEMEKNDRKLQNRMNKIIQNTSVLSPQLPNATPSILSDTSSSDDAAVESENTDSRKRNKNCNKLKADKNNLRFQKNNSSFIINEADSSENMKTSNEDETKESRILSSEPNIPFEISGDIYKPIEGHLITQEFLTPWIAKSYKNYKAQSNSGKSTLERPRRGKIILHLWECLLNRYRSRKNIFLTTTKRPFRIYIATDIRKPFFRDCINIDDIRFADLHKYPCLVKKLLTNASNKDYFCILGGWDDSWEIIGSVKKNNSDGHLSEPDLSNSDSLSQDSDFAQENWSIKEHDMVDAPHEDSLPKRNIDQIELEKSNLERSKWFLMKLENDFTEIYCHKKGFYVERAKILHAINLARITRKTVVINKQTCSEISNIPFGIYALPDTTEYCAVVGPYELEESLGLEIVKANIFMKKKTTKGYWITTNKVDNIKVLDDPMSFLPSSKIENATIQNMASNVKTNDSTTVNVQPSTSHQKKNSLKKIQKQVCLNKKANEEKIPKLVKPIKISRTNGFYHLTSKKSIIKGISSNTATSLINKKHLLMNSQNQLTNDSNCNLAVDSNAQHNTSDIDACVESGAEHIKITSVYTESETETVKKPGMFILKPEEINKKVHDYNKNSQSRNEDRFMDIDIENFLISDKSMDSTSDNGIQSLTLDEDDDDEIKLSDVWIQCPAIKNLGWIRGRKNDKNLLNLDFPGFNHNIFYTEKEAFDMINQVLSKHIRIPKNIKIEWKVLNETQANTCLKGAILNVNSLTKNYEITEKGLVKSTTLDISQEPQLFEEYQLFEEPQLFEESQLFEEPQNVCLNTDLMNGLEQTSRLLDDETVLLWNETEKHQTEIIRSLSVPEELKPGMSETLQGLMSMNNDLIGD